jgi:hypothetical protein
MERAFDLVTFKKAIAQPCIAMRAEIIGRKNFSLDAIQGNTFASDINANNIVFWNIFSRSYIDPLVTHFFFQIG